MGTNDTWYNEGTALLNTGNYDQAISCFNNSLKIDSQNIEAWNSKGLAYYKSRKYDDATTCFNKCLELNPNYIEAENNKSRINLEKTGDLVSDVRNRLELWGLQRYGPSYRLIYPDITECAIKLPLNKSDDNRLDQNKLNSLEELFKNWNFRKITNNDSLYLKITYKLD